MTDSPRSAKRRRLDGAASNHVNGNVGEHIYVDERDDDVDELQTNDVTLDTPRLQITPRKTANGTRVSPQAQTAEFDIHEDPAADAEIETTKRSSSRRQRVDYAALNSSKHSDSRLSLVNGASGRKSRVREAEETVDEDIITTPSKPQRSAQKLSTPRSRRPNGIAQVGEAADRDDSPPPSLTPSRRDRVWPKQYTNKGQKEARLAAKAKDPVVASPHAMLGRLVQNGQSPVSKFRIVNQTTSEPVLKPTNRFKGPVGNESIRVIKRPQPALARPPRIEASEQELARSIVLEKLTGKRPIPLVGLDEEYQMVFQVAEQTVTAGEGNSMLIIGPRGSGKSALLNRVIQELSKDKAEEFHVIRLNGFIHTDDKLALREIWRQLGREMEVEEDEGGNSYADTLARLLALLSHPSELSDAASGSIAKAVVFIMDEFDLFASHPRQTLLYNLFDVAQSRKAPIAIFGLTTRIDVAESLEKRVKSRFSHRYVYLSLSRSLAMYKEICRTALAIYPDELTTEEKEKLMPSLAKLNNEAQTDSAKPPMSALEIWNATVSALLGEPRFQAKYITANFHLTKSIPAALSEMQLPIALAKPATLPLNPLHFNLPTETSQGEPSIPSLSPPDNSLHLLRSLPSLSLSLLIAAARCVIIHDTSLLNFRIAYAEYASLASSARVQSASSGALATGTRVWGRDVARWSWEELVKLGLLVPAQGAITEALEPEVGEKGMVKVDVALEEIVPSCPGIEKAMEKWCKHI